MFFKSSFLQRDRYGCKEDQVCTSLTSCEPLYKLFVRASEDPGDSVWRKHIVNSMKDRICGPVEDRNVCCPKDQTEVIIGSFDINEETVSGDLILVDSQSVVIRNLFYKGKEEYPPNLIGGSSEEPHADPENAVVFTFPYQEEPIGIDDERAVLVGSFDGSRDLLLTIPHDLGFDIHDLEWISMWSRDLVKNLGHADLVFIGTNYDETIDLDIEEISQRIESEIFHDEYELDIDNADDDVEENEVDEDIVSENDEDNNDENDDEDKNDENDEIFNLFKRLN